VETPRARTSFDVGFFIACLAVLFETAMCSFFLRHRLPDILMVYLLGIVLLSVRVGYSASLPATPLSVAAVDFFFVEPTLSFDVADKRVFFTFALMAVVATVIGSQTERIRRREARTATLYKMSRELTVAASASDVATVARRHLDEIFAAESWVLIADASGGLVSLGAGGPAGLPSEGLLAKATKLLQGSAPDADEPTGSSARTVPLRASNGVQGVLAIQPLAQGTLQRPASGDLFDLFVSQIAMALERARLADETQRVQLEVKTEKLRNALLSSVSHDLRTPLAVIKGTVTALIDGMGRLAPERVRGSLETINAEATRLNRTVRNLLDVTSLEAGALRVRKEWQPLEEVIGVALNRLEEQLEDHPVQVRIEPEAALAPFDATLLEHVLVNLVENATKHAPGATPIEIHARRAASDVEITVSDRGRGVPEDETEAIFEKFRRANSSVPGMGLGLTICRGIVLAHGGRIRCRNRDGGGAAFEFSLPLEGEPPALDGLPEANGDPPELG
jgi:two-component system sensor histidine kinase KdpD